MREVKKGAELNGGLRYNISFTGFLVSLGTCYYAWKNIEIPISWRKKA